MENTLLIGLSRQVALARELDVIANNVANVNTNGFKARSATFAEFMMPRASADGFPRPDRMLSYVIDTDTPIDLSPGSIERTGNPLDIAIKGDGFLVVQTPGGERFTRNGALQLDATGQLVTSDGHPVLGENGPLVIDPAEAGVSIAADGTVSTDGGVRGRIRLVNFENPAFLKNEGANTFSSEAAPLDAAGAARLEPGAIERSNVNAVMEMTRLMDVSRAYTRMASTLESLGELRRTAIQRLGEVV